jgi:hypothetical protein
MRSRHARSLVVALAVAACGTSEGAPDQGAPAEASVAVANADLEQLPPILVYKTEGCGCCNGWVEHLRAAGFEVDARNVSDLMSVKLDAGVPADLSSCHTALVDGYVVEGHVPADVVKRMLAERPEAAGIAVPGMPVGSPGMEGSNPRPYQVQLFDRQGDRSVYARIDPR